MFRVKGLVLSTVCYVEPKKMPRMEPLQGYVNVGAETIQGFLTALSVAA